MIKSLLYNGLIVGLCAFLCAVFPTYSLAQQLTYGGDKVDRFNVGHPTSDGGFIYAGESSSYVSKHKDAYIVKTDASGNVEWSRTIGGIEAENLNDIKPTPDGGYIAVGEKYLVNGDRILGEVGSLIKLDNLGNITWSRTFHNGCREAEGFSLELSGDGYIITGMMRSAQNVSNVYFPMKNVTDHLFVMKANAEGQEQWSGFFTAKDNALGSKGRYITATPDGGFAIAGHFYVVQRDNNTKMALLKLDQDGNFSWFRLYDIAGEREETAACIQPTPDGGFIVAGSTGDAGLGRADVLLFKTDSEGLIQWARAYGSDEVDYGQRLVQTKEGYIVVGSSNSFSNGTFDVYAIGVDKSGGLQWSKTYGGDRYDAAFDIKAREGTYTISGFTMSNGSGSYDGYVIRTNAQGVSGCVENNADTKQTAVTINVQMNPGNITWNKIANSSEYNSGDCNILDNLSQEKNASPATNTTLVCN